MLTEGSINNVFNEDLFISYSKHMVFFKFLNEYFFFCNRVRDFDEKTPEPTISKQEQLRMIHLRSHLNQLTEKVKHHQYLTEKTRYFEDKCENT